MSIRMTLNARYRMMRLASRSVVVVSRAQQHDLEQPRCSYGVLLTEDLVVVERRLGVPEHMPGRSGGVG